MLLFLVISHPGVARADGGYGRVSGPALIDPGTFDAVSDDGRTVVYGVNRRLFFADAGQTTGNLGLFLYRGGEITDLVSRRPPDLEQQDGAWSAGLSGDGSTLVLGTFVRLTPADDDFKCDLYEYRDDRFSLLPGGDCQSFLGISDDGAVIYLDTFKPLSPSDTDDLEDLYEVRGLRPNLITTNPGVELSDYYAASAAPSGALVFDTPEALVGDDHDGLRDVYVFRDGSPRLLSGSLPGTSLGAHLVEASSDGSVVVYAPGEHHDDRSYESSLYVTWSDGSSTEAISPQDGSTAVSFADLTSDGSHLFYSDATGLHDRTSTTDEIVDLPAEAKLVKASADGRRLLLKRPAGASDERDSFFVLEQATGSLSPSTEPVRNPQLAAASPSFDYALFDLRPLANSPTASGELQELGGGQLSTLYENSDQDVTIVGSSSDGRTTLLATRAVLEPHDYLFPDAQTEDLYLRTPDGKARILTQRRLPLQTHLSLRSPTNRTDFVTLFDSTQQAAGFACRYWPVGASPPRFRSCLEDGYGRMRLGGLREGRYLVEGYATSIAGEVDRSPVRKSLRIDLTPPRTSIVLKPANVVRPGPVRFEMHSDTRRPQWKYQLDHGPWTSCGDRVRDTVDLGKHIFRVKSRDLAGNWSASAVDRFRVARR